MEENKNDEELEKLRLENEIRKIKLSLETGATFIEGPEMSSLPPEVENEFLNYIEQFETMSADSPKISVFEKLGSPSFKFVQDIPDDRIEEELEKLRDLMDEKGIAIDSIYDVDDREMYRFITEELFKHELYDMFKLEGMVTQFTYEEFHPNDEEDIKKNANEFYQTFFNKNHNYYTYHTSTKTNTWFEDFRNAYQDFITQGFEIIEFTMSENEAVLIFDIDFLGILDERQTHQYKGRGKMTMENDGYWSISKVEFPEAN
jgi:hypothetical protein